MQKRRSCEQTGDPPGQRPLEEKRGRSIPQTRRKQHQYPRRKEESVTPRVGTSGEAHIRGEWKPSKTTSEIDLEANRRGL